LEQWSVQGKTLEKAPAFDEREGNSPGSTKKSPGAYYKFRREGGSVTGEGTEENLMKKI